MLQTVLNVQRDTKSMKENAFRNVKIKQILLLRFA
jgi:hypothetical protein